MVKTIDIKPIAFVHILLKCTIIPVPQGMGILVHLRNRTASAIKETLHKRLKRERVA